MSTCLIPANWEVVRITRVDACGRPVYGECNAVVSRCIATITDSPEVEEAEARTQTGFDGTPCFTAPGCDTVSYHELEITWSEISIDGFSILNPGYRITRDSSGQAIGMFANNKIDCSTGYAIEVWASAGGQSDICVGETDAEGAWYYRVYPWISGATPGEVTMGGTDEVAFPMTGRTKSGSRWGRGPYMVTLMDGVPSPLPEPFDPDEDEPFWEGLVTLPPPEADCDCVDVERPIPEPATLIITGNSQESPRCSVNLFVDNAGLGPVVVDWGDGSAPQEIAELTTVTHRYPNCDSYSYSYGDDTVIRVCDQQDPGVCAEKAIQLPLPPDEPQIAITDAGTPEEPNRVTATVVLPPQASGDVVINWGDRQTTEVTADETGVIEAQHVYKYPGRYRACAARAERPQLKGCQVVTVPMGYSNG